MGYFQKIIKFHLPNIDYWRWGIHLIKHLEPLLRDRKRVREREGEEGRKIRRNVYRHLAAFFIASRLTICFPNRPTLVVLAMHRLSSSILYPSATVVLLQHPHGDELVADRVAAPSIKSPANQSPIAFDSLSNITWPNFYIRFGKMGAF